MWNSESRQRHERRGLRYPSDLTDAEWALIAPMIPPARVFADRGYPGPKAASAVARVGSWTLEIVRRAPASTASPSEAMIALACQCRLESPQ